MVQTMLADLLEFGTWGFQIVLLGLLVFTLIYARRLDRSIIQMRAERQTLQELIDRIGTSVTAAIDATDRLTKEAGESSIALDEACQAAAAATKRLDDAISQATIVANMPALAERQEAVEAPLKPVVVTPPQGTTLMAPPHGVLTAKPNPLARTTSSRRPVKLPSRAERDLARMLADAT
jgi:hypothetical protein